MSPTLITTRELRRRVGYSRQHLLRLEKSGAFPRRIKLVPNGKAFWDAAEVDRWLEDRLASRDDTLPGAPGDDPETEAA